MSFAAYILLTFMWIFLVWVVSILVAQVFKSLAAWPEYWLANIIVAFGTPLLALAVSSVGIQPPEALSAISSLEKLSALEDIQKTGMLSGGVKIAALAAYRFGVVFALMSIARGWIYLARARRRGEQQVVMGRDIILTRNVVPLCAFGFIKPVILVPENLLQDLKLCAEPKLGRLLLAHEAAHIRYYDPLVMVGLLVLKSILWPHPAAHDFVKRWQCAAELRADDMALAYENVETRKQYGQILVNVLRRFGAKNSRGTQSHTTWPCPSASLNLSNYRSAKMRVKNILNDKVKPRKSGRLKFQLGLLALITAGFGAYGLASAASPSADSDKDAQPILRVPPIYPAKCTASEGKFAASVSVKFDVDKAGNVENVRVTKSDNDCFDQASINSVLKWKYAPVLHKGKPRKRRNVQAMLKYMAP